MSDRRLYSLAVPNDAQLLSRQDLQRRLSAQGAVSGGVASVESVSLEPGEQLLRGQYRGFLATVMAAEIEELFDAPDITTVPYYLLDERAGVDGYYSTETVSSEPVDPREADLAEFDARLTKQGTRRSHWRSVGTSVTQPTNGNPFNDGTTTANVGIPASASKVRWLDPVDKSTESASLVSTHQTEFGDVELYDADASTFTDPTLIYDVPYADEGPVDVRVWDDRDTHRYVSDSTTTVGSATVGSARVAPSATGWQRVFAPSHQEQGTLTVENGRTHLKLDDTNNDLRVYSWDTDDEFYALQGEGDSTWELHDVDLTRIGLARVTGQLEFRDPSQSPTAFYNLNVSVMRGLDAPWFWIPDNESTPIPSGLDTKLDPLGHDSAMTARADQGLVAREETNV